jgi:N-glycosylase/DNA lyase
VDVGPLEKFRVSEFDLAVTLDSGQTFHWQQVGGGYAGTIGDRPVFLEQRGNTLLVSRGQRKLVENYFALDHPLAEICRAFPDDPAMRAARDYCTGLRILRQPHWECLATFITSSMKQVAHIRQMSAELRRRFGIAVRLGEVELRAFPSADRIARSSEQDLRRCGLGYRAKNLLATAKVVSSGAVDLQKLGKLPDRELLAALCELPGVGAKVANCVMLFAYERLRAFPIDVWIERVLTERYFPRRRKLKAGELAAFAEKYFGEHCGYAQQYLFHHARKTTPRKRR